MPENTENVIFPLITWDQASDHRCTSSRRLTITPCTIVGGLRQISKATANARDAVAGFVLPALPFFLLVRDSYGVKNTRLTIRQLPRSFVILANYPARAHTHNRRSCRKCKSRTVRISDSQGCDCAISRYTLSD